MSKSVTIFGVLVLVCACSGSSDTGSSDTIPAGGEIETIRNLGASPAIHGVDGTTLNDALGKTLRIFSTYAANYNSSLAGTEAMVGNITFLDDGTDRIRLDFPNTSPTIYSPTAEPGEYEFIPSNPNSALEKTATLVQVGEGYVFSIFIPARVGSNFETYYGAFGFETPEDIVTGSVNYAGVGVFHMTNNQAGMLTVTGTSDFNADFASGRINGTLLEINDPQVDVNGNGVFNDTFSMTLTLEDGVISSDGFTGQVSATGSTVLGGVGSPIDLDVSVKSSGADGAFFGANADTLAVVYGGDLVLTQPGFDAGSFEFSGLSTAERQ